MTTDITSGESSLRNPTDKQKGAGKTAWIPIKIVPAEKLKKPDWIRVKAGSPTTRFYEIKDILRANNLVTVCEEASCPNIGECFGKGTATFMIMGDKCTRRCPFCDVGHGRPDPLDVNEPRNLSKTIADLRLSYVVITSVDPHRSAGARLPRPPAKGPRHFQGRPARRHEPQSGNGAPPVQGSPPRRRLQALARTAARFQSHVPERRHQVRHHGGPGRNGRRDPASDARHARAQRRNAHHRPIPRPLELPPPRAPLRAPGRV